MLTADEIADLSRFGEPLDDIDLRRALEVYRATVMRMMAGLVTLSGEPNLSERARWLIDDLWTSSQNNGLYPAAKRLELGGEPWAPGPHHRVACETAKRILRASEGT